MNFVLIGVNHRTAPVEVRERFAISEARLPEAVKALASYPGIEEGMIVSTCNRVELLARTVNGTADLDGFMRQLYGFDPQPYRQYLYEYHEREAVQHVFRVASSLDSMVVGEPQILGQVKEAYATARAVGAVNSQLDALLSRAFAVAKRVRNETAVATSAVSVASVAVDLAKKIFGNLQGKSVYLVGAGKMCELAARHLVAHGAKQIYVANRTYERAVALASKFNGEAIPFEQLYETVPRADIVISSTGRASCHLPQGAWRALSEPSPQPSHVLHRYRCAARYRSGDEQAGRHLRLRYRRPAAGGVVACGRSPRRSRPRRSHRAVGGRQVSGAAPDPRRGADHRLAPGTSGDCPPG